MRVLIDTNILFVAAVYPNGHAAKAYYKATKLPYLPIVCDYCIDEFKRIIRKKRPMDIEKADSFLATALLSAEVISTPSDNKAVSEEAAIRDVKDKPIIRAAIKSKVDIILTGDKDFLESGLKKPKMLSPAEFLLHKH